MARFLLDADLSPKVGRFLISQLQLDVISLQGQRLGQIPDSDVVRMARAGRRVITTLDRDFASHFAHSKSMRVGVVYLDLPNDLRTIPEINRVLEQFFRTYADSIDLEHSLVTITANEVHIEHG